MVGLVQFLPTALLVFVAGHAADRYERKRVDNIFAGVRFIRESPAILGTISLDLFAVLFGGVTALLPIYARDIQHTGPVGLGVLRGAPAVGALLMTMVLARHAISRHVGMRMFQAALGGVCTVAVALLWMKLFPSLRQVERLE